MENKFSNFLKKFTIKKSANNGVFKHINKAFEMEINKEMFKQDNADQVKLQD